MTSRIYIAIPACLISILVSLAFVNIAYADDAIWRETNNLYNQQIEEAYGSGASSPYRLYLLRSYSNLEPGTYSMSFQNSSDISSNDVLVVSIDGSRNFTYFNDVITFTLPENYSYIDIFIESREYIASSAISDIMMNEGNPLPYEPYYSGFRFDFAAIAQSIGQYVQPILTTILPYIFLMIALIIGVNAGIRVFRKTAT